MNHSFTTCPRQGNLFEGVSASAAPPTPPPLLRSQLQAWIRRLADHQGPLFSETGPDPSGFRGQGQLPLPQTPELLPGIHERAATLAEGFAPLQISPQSLSFWRWPRAPQSGPALYLVIDHPTDRAQPLLLYIGETGQADRRWKGEHDCKRYLAAYAEAMGRASLESCPSIRFWCDVPAATAPRRALEQFLIRRWLPPFNKETRQRWATPFTADPG